ncbi:unnamed protein product, partial [Iphiclides podalirius]
MLLSASRAPYRAADTLMPAAPGAPWLALRKRVIKQWQFAYNRAHPALDTHGPDPGLHSGNSDFPMCSDFVRMAMVCREDILLASITTYIIGPILPWTPPGPRILDSTRGTVIFPCAVISYGWLWSAERIFF